MIPSPALPGPFASSPWAGDTVGTPAVLGLVRAQTRELLEQSPAYRALPPEERRELAHNLVKISSYGAELVRDQWLQAHKLGQRPVLVEEAAAFPPTTTAAAAANPPPEQFAPRAVNQAGRLTQETLNAVAFPTFVADLIKGTFQAVVDASIQQMEAYGKLLANVAKTIDQFMSDNISDNQARDFLVESYPEHFKLETSSEGARVKARETERDAPDWKSTFGLNDDVRLDDESAEGVFVPAARRRLAQNRHQMLSTMVLMGINRIVITSGQIKATMAFHLEARDAATAERAEDFDFRHSNEFSAGGGLGGLFGGPKFKSRTSVAYVSSTKRNSTDEVSLSTDLTAQVDLKFKSDYFPLERFAKTGVIAQIQQNTANPTANVPAGQQTTGGR